MPKSLQIALGVFLVTSCVTVAWAAEGLRPGLVRKHILVSDTTIDEIAPLIGQDRVPAQISVVGRGPSGPAGPSSPGVIVIKVGNATICIGSKAACGKLLG